MMRIACFMLHHRHPQCTAVPFAFRPWAAVNNMPGFATPPVVALPSSPLISHTSFHAPSRSLTVLPRGPRRHAVQPLHQPCPATQPNTTTTLLSRSLVTATAEQSSSPTTDKSATTTATTTTSTSTSTSTDSTSSASTTRSPSSPSSTTDVVRWKVRAIQDAPESEVIGKHVRVNGWVRSIRNQKKFAFIDLNDGSSLTGLQLVVNGDNTSAYAVLQDLTTGSSIRATGDIVQSQGAGQSVELKVDQLTLLGPASSEYPLQKKRHSLEFLRSIAHLRARTNSIGAMARVRSKLAFATHQFFHDRGFVYLHSPIITASDCEGAGEMFRVTTAIPASGAIDDIAVQTDSDSDKDGNDNSTSSADVKSSSDSGTEEEKGEKLVDFSKDFFSKPAFLTVSGQLSAETYACALSDVYTFGPTFRAENSNTSRHLAEFWMVEPEMAFATLEDNMDNAEAYVKYIVSTVLNDCAGDVEFFNKFVAKGLLDKLKDVVEHPFARVSYTEAIDLLLEANKPNKKGKKRFEYDVSWGIDLQSEHERYLAEVHFKRPVFVYNYPAPIKAFYMRANDDDDGKTVQAMDLLVPGIGELIGGSAREERLDVLKSKIESNGLDIDTYWWYLDLRRFGSVPHAGYGLGFERLVQFVTGMENIRDVIPFPRYPGNAEF